MNVYSSSTSNLQNLGATEVAFNEWKNKPTHVTSMQWNTTQKLKRNKQFNHKYIMLKNISQTIKIIYYTVEFYGILEKAQI